MKNPLHTLRGKFLLLALMISMIPLIFQGGLIFLEAFRLQDEDIRSQLQRAAMISAERVDTLLTHYQQDAQIVAANHQMQSADLKEVYAAVVGSQELWPQYASIAVLDARGNLLVDSAWPLATTTQIRQNFSDRSYFKLAMQGQTNLSDVQKSPRAGGATVLYSASPIFDGGPNPTGVVVLTILTSEISRILEESWLGGTGDAYLVNEYGYMVSPSRFNEELVASGLVQRSAELEIQMGTAGSQKALKGEAGVDVYGDFRSRQVLGGYAPIPSKHWAVLVEQDVAEAFLPVRKLQAFSVMVALAVLVLVIVGALVAAQSLTAYLYEITRAAERVQSGDLNVHLPLRSHDEVGRLAETFNVMTERMRGLVGDLRQQVDDRAAANILLEQEIGERRKIQAELETYQHSLEALVAGRTAELHQLYAEVEREKLFFEALVLASPVAIAVAGMDRQLIAWNPAAEAMFGYSRQEALGRNIDELVAGPEERSEAMTFTEQALSGLPLHVLTRRTRRDGTRIDVELAVMTVFLAGKPNGFVVVYHDITELQKARQEAEAATLAKSEFLANMSHEIRTPMNAIIGMSGLLLDTPLSQEQHEFAETIRISSDALLSLINDILDFSKIEAGHLDLEQEPFRLRECIESALDLVATRACEKNLEIGYLVDENVPDDLKGDVTRLRQILINLLNNAVKFTEKGEVLISVEALPVPEIVGNNGFPSDEAPGLRLHFAVRDTGLGIPADRMYRLFRSFSQVDASTTRRFGGTGLGLAISRHLAELMGGEMWVESEGIPGKGSTFHFSMRTAVATGVSQRPHDDLTHLMGLRVLIVDDNPTNRLILKRQTEAWGMESVEVEEPLKALDLIKRGEVFDLALLDMQMPDMDGLTLASEIRRVRVGREIKLVMLTSLGRRDPRAERMDLDAFLTKPIKPSVLYNTLQTVFSPQTAPEAAPEPVRAYDSSMAEWKPLRILLAEDHAVNQKVAQLLLSRLGYRSDVAANGMEVLEALQRQPYDVILMDVQMPELDGLEATRIICRDYPQADQPYIIAMTAHAMQGDREECFSAGMRDYVTKPVRINELQAALSKVPARSGILPSQTAVENVLDVPSDVPADPPAESAESAGQSELSPAGSAAQKPAIDLQVLMEYFPEAGESGIITELAAMYLEDTPLRLAELQTALSAGNMEAVRRAAHSIKGASLTFGAMRFAEYCRRLEQAGKDGNLEEGPLVLAQALDEFSRVRRELELIGGFD